MAQKIKDYQFSNRFKKEYKSLTKDIRKAFDKKLSLFLNNIQHPSLSVKRIQGTKDIWEGTINKSFRFTFCLSGNFVVFRRIGTHDILDKS